MMRADEADGKADSDNRFAIGGEAMAFGCTELVMDSEGDGALKTWR